MLGYYDTKYDTAKEIGKPSHWAVAWKALYTFLLNPNGNRYVLYLYRNDDGQWNWNYNWLDNDWNVKNRSAVSSQVSA